MEPELKPNEPEFKPNPLHIFLEKTLEFLQKHLKWVVISGIVILVISLVYIIGAFLTDPENLVADFEKAVRSGDTEALADLVSSSDDKLTVDKKHLQQFIEYAKENNESLNDLLSAMRAQIAHYQEEYWKIPSDAPEDYLAYGDFYIDKTEIPLFYDIYSIKVRPYYIKIETNEPDAIIKVDGKKVFHTSSNNLVYTYGPVMPGKYEVSAEKKFEYAHLQNKDEITAFNDDDQTIESDLELQGETITLESKFDGTQVMVNGKPIGKTVQEVSQFGPVSLNGTIKLQGELQFPWGVEKSEEITLTEGTYSVDLTPKPFQSQENKQQVVNVINQFAKERIQAYVTLNGNVFTTVDDNVKKGFIDEISVDKELKNTYKGKALGTRIDFDHLDINWNDTNSRYEITLPVEIHELFKKYTSWDSKDEPMDEEYLEYMITLYYDENKKNWVITNIDNYFFWDNYMQGKDIVKTEFK